ncbi:hypothetical protein L3V82_12180 [Thiotrichales bacterium 19S3-7]|nr:hypothetical protein [Thiotrichales bacterium 19S3-7]MCF6802947.1 hypothetical protein [Thiotrichales bacterium 19S3-11]
MDWYNFLIPLIGALVGGLFTLVSASYSFYKLRSHSLDIEKRQVENFVKSIRVELNVLFDQYMGSMGTAVENLQQDQKLDLYYPLTQDYFIVYHNNSRLIGSIEDSYVRNQIIRIYTVAKGLVDSFRMNNEILSNYEHECILLNRDRDNNESTNSILVAYEDSLKAYAISIKQSHSEFKQQLEILNDVI